LLDPTGKNGKKSITLKSPRYPSKYSHKADCRWNLEATKGKLSMKFVKFNVEYNKKCEKKDYLFVGSIAKYSSVYLCGSSIPKGFKLTSKKKVMTVKFHSNKSVTKPGFSVKVIATG